jgi:hypothetical protein
MLLIIAYKPDLTPPKNCSREEAQWIRTTPNEEEVTNSNPPPSCVDMSKKKKKPPKSYNRLLVMD